MLLTADAFGVLPPVSILDGNETMYHFVMGFTSKLAGTEVGVTEPEPSFSSCFGAAFMSQKPAVYAELLAARMADALLEEGIYVIGFNYPVVPKGQARIRVQLSAAHSQEHLKRAIAAFAKVGRNLGVIP